MGRVRAIAILSRGVKIPGGMLALAALLAVGCARDDSDSGMDAGQAADGWVRTDQPAAPDEQTDRVTELGDAPTLADYVNYAELNNAGLRAAYDEWQAALEQVAQAKALPDPRLSYSNYIESVETRVGPQNWSVTLAQSFPWFGTLSLRGRMAAHGADAVRAQYESARLALVYEITTGYCEYYYLARAVAVTEQNVELLSDLETVAREEYAAGTASHAAVVRAQVELARLADRLETLKERRRPVVARLNAALNRPVEASLPWPSSVPEGGEVGAREALREMLVESNPDVRMIDAMAAKAQAAVALARKQRYPDLTLGLTYISTGEAVMPVGDSGKDPVIAMVSVNVPIWGRKYRAAEREARSRLGAVAKQREDKVNALVSRLEMAVFGVEDAGRKIALYRDTLIPQAEQAMVVSQQAFTAGNGSFLDVIDAERTLLQVQLEYERALVERAERLAEVEMLVGRPLTQAGQPAPDGASGNSAEPETVTD